MRLRTLSEAECYARCYGGLRDETVSLVRIIPRQTKRATSAGEHLRRSFELRLESHGPEAEAA
jgi:hypothetical protein